MPKGIIKSGSSVFNTLIYRLNNVMTELHIPGYNYCGPFTKLVKRLARGDETVNKLDYGCNNHDILYRDHKDIKERHIADKELENRADERIHASDSNICEKVDAVFVKTLMKSKRYLGLGVGNKY
jgi:hypothetical protein